MELFILYKCDSWHTNSSMERIGVFTSENELIKQIRTFFEKKITLKIARSQLYETIKDHIDDLVFELRNYNQTQCYFDGGFQIEHVNEFDIIDKDYR